MNTFKPPKWSREFIRFLPAKSQFILWGNIHDFYPVQIQAGITTMKMDDFINTILRRQTYTVVVKYEPLAGFTMLKGGDAETFTRISGLKYDANSPSCASLPEAAGIIEKLVKFPGVNCAVMINFASRLTELCGYDSNDVNDFFYHMFRLMNEVSPKYIKNEEKKTATSLYSPLIWLLDKDNDLPSWYTLNNARIRNLPVPKPDHDIRRYIIESISPKISGYETASDERKRENSELFISQTAGLYSSEIIAIVQLSRREGLKWGDIAEAIRRYKLGITENLWAKLDHDKIRNAEAHLSSGVMGQERAVRHVADILKRSVYNLSGSQFSRHTQRPKGVLFFAGPTGVGKTELAKAITELVFGSPTNYIRFDMSEFGHDNADQRLVGSPPGYVGYEVGGELTNAIKQNPFSVILFDEVEKAHPKILDMFLQILDDGRLTSGRGETVYFSESLIIFTSNLGVYEQMPDGTKRQNVTPEMPYEEINLKINNAIDDFFRYRINRPEILNRIGKNVIVFDFIRPDTAKKILQKMLSNVIYKLKDSHNIDLIISDSAYKTLSEEVGKDLTMGVRGVGNTLEDVLINPLSRALFENPAGPEGKITVNGITETNSGWELSVNAS